MQVSLGFCVVFGLVACSGSTPGGSSASTTGGGSAESTSSGSGAGSTGQSTSGASGTGNGGSGTAGPSSAGTSTGARAGTSTAGTTSGGGLGDGGCGPCPGGDVCGSANGLPVCRAPSGIPLFSHVFVIVMENLSQSTLIGDGGYPSTPYLATLAQTAATSTDYHGVSHPSLPNYIALTSGADVSGIACDCFPTGGACTGLTCNLAANALGTVTCGCPQTTATIADDLETNGLGWKGYGEDMQTACNVTASGNYAPKHVPFLYYPQVQTNAARCDAHVVDFAASFASDLQTPSSFPSFAFISPNLIDDMHNPPYPNNGPQNLVNGDTWLAAQVPAILASAAYRNGGILFIVWDEDDDSGGLTGTNDPIPLFVISPYAKSGGYQSTVQADHYALLATFEDGLGLPRVGDAVTSTPLTDFFPDQ